MPPSKVLLADGTEGFLSKGESYCSVTCFRGTVWALRSCGTYFDALDSRDGELLDSVSLPEGCETIRLAANKLWLLTRTGNIILYELSGVLIGVLNADVGRIDSLHTFENDPSFFATSQKGAFQTWDLERMAVQRVFPCEGADVLAVFPTRFGTSLLTVQEDRIALWGEEISHPMCVHFLESANSAVLVCSQHNAAYADTCWVGGNQWITVFHVEEKFTQMLSLKKERLIPCAKVQQLVSISLTRVASFDAEFLVTIWDSCNCVPVRLFKVDSAMGIGRGTSSPVLFLTGVARVATIWVLGGNILLSWADQEFDDDRMQAAASEMAACTVIRSENAQICKKYACLLEMMDTYRKTVVDIVSSPNRDRASMAATISALDKCFGEQMTALRSEDDRPRDMVGGNTLRKQVEYWREKYMVEKERNRLLLSDLRLAVDRLKEVGPDSRVDSQLLDLLALNATSQARESQLRSRVLHLEAQLHKLDTTDSHNNDFPTHDSQSNSDPYRTRVIELEKELHCALEASEEAVTAQRGIANITDALGEMERTLHVERGKFATLTKEKSLLERETEKMFEALSYLQEELKKAIWEKDECTELLKRHQLEAEENERRASLLLAETKEELHLLRQGMEKLEENRHLASTLSIRDTEIIGLKRQLEFVKSMISIRHEEGIAASSAYDAMMDIIQTMKHESPITFLLNVLEDIDIRLGHLSSSTRKWMERDDQVAARDDEIRVLKNRVQSLESSILRVSSLFQHIPYTIEDVESLLLEVNEYRQRYGRNEEIEELVALRLLELAAGCDGEQVAENAA
ncbi:hypothetical protein TcCL_NonESM03787 [Trypanosoma cruzi]|uniref:Uncharacterized protein n=1 Tax=Trypanosoma cruzi (strain CL Brener) TaxID=353153 RepID=Q4DMF3_TRYCC|nr:hypothetical protein Tc00.1047053506443.60 [Trypanosoma cruzi]EAN93706.1 hypothetical protein Tc00.1047053506443.60 [Trypanosoma cruzi]RNC46429.1 hypothetical protein TcCL_NonESM03787 [Trypanosoma cruzi]|eukprot:XP_815557.1 hypothetical protein [Trypanosoma cruzi strain CL Brener]